MIKFFFFCRCNIFHCFEHSYKV